MAIPFTTEINPRGTTVEEIQNDLIKQLKIQNKELRVIIEDLYKNLKGAEK